MIIPEHQGPIRPAPVRKRLARYAKNIGLSPPTLPHGRGSDRNPPPTGPSELSFLSVDTRTPYVVDYPGEDAGKPLTRGSGEGSEPLRRECRNQQVDRLSARAAVLERSLPLPGLFRRLAFFEVDQLNWQTGLGGANLAGPMLGQTPEQVVRASVVAASVAAV